MTKDLDAFIKADSANAHATYAALAGYGAPLDNIGIGDLADPRKFIRFGREPVAIDILPGVDAETGLTAHFISREDLIAAKLAAGRLRDLAADVEAIREAAESETL